MGLGDVRVRLTLLATFAAVLAAIWVPDFIATHDGPNHLLAGYAHNHLGDPEKGYADFLEPGAPFHGQGFFVLFCNLERVMSWRTALRISYSIGAAIWIAGVIALASALRKERAWLAAPLSGAAICWSFEMGFFAFWIGSGLSFSLIAWALRTERRGVWFQAISCAALAGLIYAHAFAALNAWVALAAVAISRKNRGSLLRVAAALLPSALVVCAGTLGSFWSVRQKYDAAIAKPALDFGTLEQHLTLFADTFVSGPSWRSWPFVALAVGGVVTAAWRLLRGELDERERALMLLGVTMLTAAQALPLHTSDVQFFSPRFVPLGVVAASFLIPVERWRSPAAPALAGALALVTPLWSTWWHTTFCDRHRALLVDGPRLAVKSRGSRLPLILIAEDSPIAYQQPLHNGAHVYAIDQGGMVPYMFGTQPSMHRVLFRRARTEMFPEAPGKFLIFDHALGKRGDASADQGLLQHMARLAARYDDVILYGQADHLRVFLDRGFVADASQGDLMLGHFEGCPMKLRVNTGAPLRAKLTVTLGWTPLAEPQSQLELEAGSPLPDRGRLLLPGMPCGPAWLDVSFDDDGVPGPSAGDSTCTEGGGQHRLTFSARAKTTVDCTDPRASP